MLVFKGKRKISLQINVARFSLAVNIYQLTATILAEKEGFEPSKRLTVYMISNHAP